MAQGLKQTARGPFSGSQRSQESDAREDGHEHRTRAALVASPGPTRPPRPLNRAERLEHRSIPHAGDIRGPGHAPADAAVPRHSPLGEQLQGEGETPEGDADQRVNHRKSQKAAKAPASFHYERSSTPAMSAPSVSKQETAAPDTSPVYTPASSASRGTSRRASSTPSISSSDTGGDADAWRCNVYVGNLPYSVTEDELAAHFSGHGPIIRCKLGTVKLTGQPAGFGFVQFSSPSHADAAIDALNGSTLGQRTLRVSLAHPPPTRPKLLQSDNLYVCGLPLVMNEAGVYQVFSPFGSVTSVRLLTDTQGRHHGVGFVRFERADEAANAIAGLNGWIIPGAHEPLTVRLARESSRLLPDTDSAPAHERRRPARPKTNVYVSGLPLHYQKAHLDELFNKFGKIIGSRVLEDPVTNASRGIGFVRFSAHQAALDAIAEMHGYIPQDSAHKQALTVKFARESKRPEVAVAPPPPAALSQQAPYYHPVQGYVSPRMTAQMFPVPQMYPHPQPVIMHPGYAPPPGMPFLQPHGFPFQYPVEGGEAVPPGSYVHPAVLQALYAQQGWIPPVQRPVVEMPSDELSVSETSVSFASSGPSVSVSEESVTVHTDLPDDVAE